MNYDISKLYCCVCNKEIDLKKEKRTSFNPDFNQEMDLCSKKCYKIMSNSRYGRKIK